MPAEPAEMAEMAEVAHGARPRPRLVLLLGILLCGFWEVGVFGDGAGVADAAETAAEALAKAPTEKPNNSAGTRACDFLGEVRDQLRARSPLAADFTQTFVPSGFSSGDTESGTLYIDLPRCLRFEYQKPFPKNFLLCGDWVYTWNPGDPSGRRFLVNDSEAAGIDLLRLEVEALKGHYRAELGAGDASRTVIRLIPTDGAADIREASVEVGKTENSSGTTETPSLLALAYVDRSGNRTRFEIAGYRKLATKADFETPPLEWLED